MKVWLIYPYGTLPGEGWREDRPTFLAGELEKAGHSVVWWVSNFEHRSKTFRSEGWKDVPITPGYLVRLVPTCSYPANMSPQRIRSEKEYGRRMAERARGCPPEERPDLIVLRDPALFYGGPIMKLARQWEVPVVIDVIDLWPELFQIALPKPLAPAGGLLFLPLYRRRASLFRKADGLAAVTKDYLALACKIAPNRPAEVVYWAANVDEVREGMRHPAELPASLAGREKREGEVWAIYAGTLGNNYDVLTILKAAKLLEGEDANVTLLIAGDGPLRGEIVATLEREGLKNTVYVGSLSSATLSGLYARCDVALLTYVAGSTVSMPIKAFESFAAGLPIISSLGGDTAEYLKGYGAGLQYEAENPRSLADAILSLASDKDRLKEMARRSYELGADFDIPVQYRKFVRLLETVHRGFTPR